MGWVVLMFLVLLGLLAWIAVTASKPYRSTLDNADDKKAAAIESDAQRLEAAPGRAFDWVAQEIEFSSSQERAALCAAWMATRNEGWSSKARRALESAWSDSVRWPSGEGYLRTLGWRPACEIGAEEDDEYEGLELMELLHRRLSHVTHRLYRDAQVRAVIDPASPAHWQKCTAVIINMNSLYTKRNDPCGIGRNKRMSIADGLEFMRRPAHPHPACRCTVDPHLATGRARRKNDE